MNQQIEKSANKKTIDLSVIRQPGERAVEPPKRSKHDHKPQALTVSGSQLVLRNDQGSDGPEGAGEQAVRDAHDGDGDVGVEEREGEQDVAEERDGDGGKDVGDV